MTACAPVSAGQGVHKVSGRTESLMQIAIIAIAHGSAPTTTMTSASGPPTLESQAANRPKPAPATRKIQQYFISGEPPTCNAMHCRASMRVGGVAGPAPCP